MNDDDADSDAADDDNDVDDDNNSYGDKVEGVERDLERMNRRERG